MRAALAFYTGILDFERVDGDDTLDDPSFSFLAGGGGYLFLSSHRGETVPDLLLICSSLVCSSDLLLICSS
jgi:hypothetical protein